MYDDEALLLADAVDVADLPGFADGDVSIQDAAAQLGARLLAPQPGERILDACAAPGGKTGHLLELQPELAELVAVDVSSERLTRIADNLQRLGIVGDAGRPATPPNRPAGGTADPSTGSCSTCRARRPASSAAIRTSSCCAGRMTSRRSLRRQLQLLRAVVGAACAGRAAGLRELLGAAGRNRGGRRGISGD